MIRILRKTPPRRLILFKVCIASLVLSGCMTYVRAPGNHSLSHTRLPMKPDYKGIALILQSAPSADFAFLLARKYPESYVIVVPSNDWTRYDKMYFFREMPVGVGDTVKVSPRDADIPAPMRKLDKYLIFHDMKVISCPQVSSIWTRGATMELAWSQENYETRAPESVFELLYLPLTIISLGSLTPPAPCDFMGQPSVHPVKLVIKINSDYRFGFVSRDNANKGYVMGNCWAMLLAPFLSESAYSYIAMTETDGISSGTHADCLEQMFSDSLVQRFAGVGDVDLQRKRDIEFRSMYEQRGYQLDLTASGERHLVAHKKWPNACYFVDHQQSDGPRYFWIKYNSVDAKNTIVSAGGTNAPIKHEKR